MPQLEFIKLFLYDFLYIWQDFIDAYNERYSIVFKVCGFLLHQIIYHLMTIVQIDDPNFWDR